MYCIFTVCLNKDYGLPASLDHRIVSDDYMVMSCTFVMGSPLSRVRPSVFGWWLPLPHPPVCWDFLTQHKGVCSGQTVILCLMIAVLQSHDSQTVRYLEGSHYTAQLAPRSAISLLLRQRPLLSISIMALQLLLLETLHPSLCSLLFSEWKSSLHWSSQLEMQPCVWLILCPLHLSSPTATNCMRTASSTHICLDIPRVSYLNCFPRLLFSCQHYSLFE